MLISGSEQRDSLDQATSYQSSSDQFCRPLAHNWCSLSLFLRDTHVTLDGLLLLQPMLCKVLLAARWDILSGSTGLNSVVNCAVLLRHLCSTRFSPISFTFSVRVVFIARSFCFLIFHFVNIQTYYLLGGKILLELSFLGCWIELFLNRRTTLV